MMTGPRSAAGSLTQALLCLLASSWALPAFAQGKPPAAPPSDPGLPGAPAAPSTAPAPATAPGEPTPGSGAPGSNQNSGAAYTVRLHDLERRMDELKEQVYRSKARLSLLKETVLHGIIAGSRALITHRNEMGSTYNLIKLVYALDGAEIYAKSDDSGHLGDTKEFEIFNGSIVPGNHTLSVLMMYQGNGFGVFSYLKGYKFQVRSSYTFAATEGKQTQLKVVGFEKGNPLTTDPKDRPAVDFRVNVVADKPTANASAAPSVTPETSAK